MSTGSSPPAVGRRPRVGERAARLPQVARRRPVGRRDLRDAFGQQARISMILAQSVYHLFQRHDASGGQRAFRPKGPAPQAMEPRTRVGVSIGGRCRGGPPWQREIFGIVDA